MLHWLMKTEPDVYSLDDLQAEAEGFTPWDGIRNYQARNFLRDSVKKGHQVFIYHSRCAQPAVVGTAEVVREAYPDPLQFEPGQKYFDPKSDPESPRWCCVDVAFRSRFKNPVTLADIKATAKLKQMVLVNNSRLSIQPVTPAEWKLICRMAADSG